MKFVGASKLNACCCDQVGHKCALSALGSQVQKVTRSSWKSLFEDKHGKLSAFVRSHPSDFKLERGIVHLKKRQKKAQVGSDGWTKVGNAPATQTAGGGSKIDQNARSNKGRAACRPDAHLQKQWGV